MITPTAAAGRHAAAFRASLRARILVCTAGEVFGGIGSALLEVDVPLSEHEQRLLEQIERALVDDDPKFASSVRSGDRRLKARRKLQIGALLILVGLCVMVGGVVVQSVAVGILGAVVMFAGLLRTPPETGRGSRSAHPAG